MIKSVYENNQHWNFDHIIYTDDGLKMNKFFSYIIEKYINVMQFISGMLSSAQNRRFRWSSLLSDNRCIW